MGGVTLIALGTIPLIAARGLLRRRSWSRGPAIITQLMALPVAWTLLRAGALIPAGIVLAAVAVTGLVLLVNPATTQALGIRGAGARATAGPHGSGRRTPGATPGAGAGARGAAARLSTPRRGASRGAGPACGPAGGRRASGRCRPPARSATGSCCRRIAAAGSASPAAAGPPAAA